MVTQSDCSELYALERYQNFVTLHRTYGEDSCSTCRSVQKRESGTFQVQFLLLLSSSLLRPLLTKNVTFS